MNISGSAVLITGASEGIGAGCAKAFQSNSALLSLTALNAGGTLPAPRPGLVSIAGDLTDTAVRRTVVERTIQELGSVDILINCAGVGLYSPTSHTPLDLSRRMFELNVFAAVEMAQLVLPHMLSQKSGLIVNIASVGAKVTLPWSTMYCASKYALAAFSEGLRRELHGTGVRVMTVYPGIVSTNFRDNVLEGSAPQRVSAISRVISPEQLAAAIVRGVLRNSGTVVLPRVGHLFMAMNQVLPSLMDWYLRRQTVGLERQTDHRLPGAATQDSA